MRKYDLLNSLGVAFSLNTVTWFILDAEMKWTFEIYEFENKFEGDLNLFAVELSIWILNASWM